MLKLENSLLNAEIVLHRFTFYYSKLLFGIGYIV